MARYFIVTPQSGLYHEYFAWKDNCAQINKHVQKFFSDWGIVARIYGVWQDSLYVEPAPEDLKRFGSMLGKDVGNGLRPFKRNSKIGKAWVRSLEECGLKILRKPLPLLYFEGVYGKYKTKLFDINGTVYCSIEPDPFGGCPLGMQEITASEFYRVVEDKHAKESA